jgi:hypothetical protein
MIKRITMFVATALLALSLAAPAAFAASPVAEECAAKGGTFESSSKTCTYPVGNSGKSKTATFHDAGSGDQESRTNPNGKTLPNN